MTTKQMNLTTHILLRQLYGHTSFPNGPYHILLHRNLNLIPPEFL